MNNVFTFTPTELVMSIHSKKWRMDNLYVIRNKAGKTVLFRKNATQERLDRSKSRWNMTLKGRQQGVSTYYIIRYLDDVLWTENENAVIQSHDRQSLSKLFRICNFAYKNMPEEIKPRIAKGGGSKHEMYFPDINSRISVALEVRSESVSKLHISEYAFMDKQRFNASIEAVPTDTGEVSIESTPFGMNHFHDDWVNPDFPYKKHFFPWYFHHENTLKNSGLPTSSYTDEEKELVAKAKKLFDLQIHADQIAWRRFKIAQKDLRTFQEEHPEDDVTCFLVSGNSVMDLQMLSDMKNNVSEPLEDNGTVKVWEEYRQGETYVLGADTAEGVGTDYSVATLYHKQSRVQVAQIRGHIKPKRFAEMIVELCDKYVGYQTMPPLVAVERNNHGHAVLLWLEEHLEYDNLFTHTDDRIGFITNKVTRPIMLDTLIDAIDSEMVKINDLTTIDECMTLVDNNGKIEAMSGKHDDCVMAHAIALQMCLESGNYLENLLKE